MDFPSEEPLIKVSNFKEIMILLLLEDTGNILRFVQQEYNINSFF